MSDLATIEASAKKLATAREELSEAVELLNTAVEAAKKQALPMIKRRLQRAAERQAELHALIEATPELFVKPRTQIFHGVKLGFRKGTGGVQFEDGARVVTLIRKHFPERFDALVKVTETPIKAAIAQLPVADAKRIGCSVVDASDAVFIGFVDSAVDKMVAALLADAIENETAVVAA